jgi:hypothetical protein
MNNENFVYIDTVNIDNEKKIIDNISEEEWLNFDFRQKTFDVHKETMTVPLLFDTKFDENSLQYHYYPYFKNLLYSIEDKIYKKYKKNIKIVRAILVNLPSMKQIPEHIDSGWSLSTSRRFHIAIKTNSECIISVGGEKKNILPGEIWEINNSNKFHYVENNGNCNRVHLIIDLR